MKSSCYAVAYLPWQNHPYVDSVHRTEIAARRAAAGKRSKFHRLHPDGYGHNWVAIRSESSLHVGQTLDMDTIESFWIDS